MILGLGFVTGGIGVPITGRLADLYGMQIALVCLVPLLAAGSLLALTFRSSGNCGQEALRGASAGGLRGMPAPSGARR